MKNTFVVLSAFLLITTASISSRPLFDKEQYYDPTQSVKTILTSNDLTSWQSGAPIQLTRLAVQQTGLVNAMFNNNGQFGFGFSSAYDYPYTYWPAASYETPSGSGIEYLFAGSIWIGGVVGDDTLVSIGADGWQYVQEMWPSEMNDNCMPGNSIMTFSSPADYSFRAEFYDTLTDPDCIGDDPFDDGIHTPLNLRIVNRSHVWFAAPYQETIIYDMIITNIGDDLIEHGYVGLFYDCDVYHTSLGFEGYQDDITGHIRDEGIAYAIDNDGDPDGGAFTALSPLKTFACKYLATSFSATDTSYNWWLSNGNFVHDFGPRKKGTLEDPFRDFGEFIGTPEGDENKHYIMRHQEWDYNQCEALVAPIDDTTWLPAYANAYDFADGYDTRFLLSIGPFDLMPDSSIRVLYANFTGDAIHVNPNNGNNLPDQPYLYEANLNWDNVLANSARSDTLKDFLLDPLGEVVGLRIANRYEDSILLAWDPWVFDNVEGYEIYLYEIPIDTFPYPGVVPPWFVPDNPPLIASVGRTHRYMLTGLNENTWYAANVAHRTVDPGVGDLGTSTIFHLADRAPAPEQLEEYAFVEENSGDPVVLNWAAPDGMDIDHYNIYKLDSIAAYPIPYHAFYDDGSFSQHIIPYNTFVIDEDTFYYYQMPILDQVDSGITTYQDFTLLEDSAFYIISAVDKYGHESEFSAVMTAYGIPDRTRDVLVILNGYSRTFLTDQDSVITFYDRVLAPYQYDLYYFYDSLETEYTYNCAEGLGSVDWRHLMPYQLVIFDGNIARYDVLWKCCEEMDHAVAKYIQSGGTLAYFGSFDDYTGIAQYAPPYYYQIDDDFIDSYFGIDSVYIAGYLYFTHYTAPPFIDTLMGLRGVDPQYDWPVLEYDTAHYSFLESMRDVWPDSTAPVPAVFAHDENDTVLYRFRSIYPATSLMENMPIGLKHSLPWGDSYAFGFHLYYMQPTQALQLVKRLLDEEWGCPCLPGDVNNDGLCNLLDILYLIDFLYGTPIGSEPFPYEVCSGDPNCDCAVDMLDILHIIAHLYTEPIGEPTNCTCSNWIDNCGTLQK